MMHRQKWGEACSLSLLAKCLPNPHTKSQASILMPSHAPTHRPCCLHQDSAQVAAPNFLLCGRCVQPIIHQHTSTLQLHHHHHPRLLLPVPPPPTTRGSPSFTSVPAATVSIPYSRTLIKKQAEQAWTKSKPSNASLRPSKKKTPPTGSANETAWKS